MVIDTSALIAILEQEDEAASMAMAIEADEVRLVSAASVVEAGIVVLARRGREGSDDLDRLLEEMGAELVPVDVGQASLARAGFARFGKGRHPAGLNFGDCFAYALAKSTGQPLLYKGIDFARTDVVSALAR